jgi:hypothetical protein
MWRFVSLCSVVLVVAWVPARPAVAEEEPAEPEQPASRTGDWHLGLEALTDLPVQIGGHVSLETPYRIRVSTSLGFLPGPYVDLINAVVVAAGGYDEATADVIAGAISNSLVWRIHLGWRPFRGHGFYFEVGYALVTLGGDVSGEDLILVATGYDPAAESSSEHDYDVGSTLHMIDVEVGWEFVFWEHFVVRVAIGVAATVGAHTEVEPLFDPAPRAQRWVDGLSQYGADYLDDIYTTYVFPPVVSLGLGYRFF